MKMRRYRLFPVFLMVLGISLVTGAMLFNCAQNTDLLKGNSDPEKLIGTWEGKLLVQSIEIPLVFKIFLQDSTGLNSTLDSPVQNAFNIPLGATSFRDNEVNIEAPDLMANYSAKLANMTTLDGTWSQAGNSYPLILLKKEEKR